ncbi:TPA: LysM peptidoglycan-binding domain-containing protein [Photobacterium damselae]
MKSRILLASALLLAGCQSTQQVNAPSTTTKKTIIIEKPVTTVPTSPSSVLETQPHQVPKKTTPQLSPQQQQDLWDRIAMQIDTPIPENKRIRYYRNWYLKHPRNLQIIAERSKPFLYYITQEVEKRNMPLELALLPIVESSFDQYAYSSSAAAGLWQIIPDTGRRFGLTINSWYDGRRDIVKSTQAALNLLEYLHNKFGNWQYALAAYNTGEGRVFNAIDKNKRLGKSTDYWNLDLPDETSAYVPKLYAVADILRDPQKYGIRIPAVANKPVLQEINPGVQMDLAVAARFAGISTQELKDLNPAYHKWATAPNGPYHLLLPINKVKSFKVALANNKRENLRTVRHTVRSGDTLGALAVKYNTTVKDIQRANNLKSTQLRIGQHLSIGVKGASLVSKPKVSPSHTSSRTHTVKSGESLWNIAKKYNTNVANLRRWNNLSANSTLRIGQKLTVKHSVSNTSTKQSSVRWTQYKVRSGDSLSVIAQRHDVSVSELMKWNNISKRHYIKPGQTLKLRTKA